MKQLQLGLGWIKQQKETPGFFEISSKEVSVEILGPMTVLIFPKWLFDESKDLLERKTSFHDASAEIGIVDDKGKKISWQTDPCLCLR